jgi:hypothetical protein
VVDVVSETTLTWFRGLVADTQQRLGGLADLQREPERFHGRAVLEEDGIEAVVAPGGTPVALTLGQRSLRLGPERLAERILEAQRLAAEEANREYAAAVREVSGVDPSGFAFDGRRAREAAEQLGEAGREFQGGQR